MARTYKSVNSWDVGCDDCGKYDTVLTESDADDWIRDHVCSEEG